MSEEIDDDALIRAYNYWHDVGFDEGFDEGYSFGYGDGYEAGRESNEQILRWRGERRIYEQS